MFQDMGLVNASLVAEEYHRCDQGSYSAASFNITLRLLVGQEQILAPCLIHLHGRGRVYSLYWGQPPGGHQDKINKKEILSNERLNPIFKNTANSPYSGQTPVKVTCLPMNPRVTLLWHHRNTGNQWLAGGGGSTGNNRFSLLIETGAAIDIYKH